MSQYAMTGQSSQEDQQVSEQLAQQLQRFVHPFLEILDAYVPRVVQRANLKKSGTHTIGMNSAPKRRGKNIHLIEKHQ